MLKVVISLIIASVLVFLLQPYLVHVLDWLTQAYHWAYEQLRTVFSGGSVGKLINKSLILILLPVVIASVPALAYYLIYRRRIAYFHEMIWIIWIVLATLLLVNS